MDQRRNGRIIHLGWKIVFIGGALSNPEYYSLRGMDFGGIRYVPYNWTCPLDNHGPLAVFRYKHASAAEQELARLFRLLQWRHCPSLKLLPCVFTFSRWRTLWYIDSRGWKAPQYIDVDSYRSIIGVSQKECPWGTAFASEVMILPEGKDPRKIARSVSGG